MFPFSRSRFCRALTSLALVLPLGACVTVPQGIPADQASMSVRPYHQAIDIGGRLSVRYQANGNEESLHGSFSWEQSRDLTVVTLLSPLGQTLARIEITPQNATLMQPGQAPRVADNIDALTTLALGWPLPVSGLKNWLQAYASSAENPHLRPVPAQNSVIETPDGWRLHYVNWQQDAQPYPRRVDLQRHTAQAGEVNLRIVVDRWQPR